MRSDRKIRDAAGAPRSLFNALGLTDGGDGHGRWSASSAPTMRSFRDT